MANKKTKKSTSKTSEPEFRPLIDETSTFKPVKEIYSGYEIEKRLLLLTVEKDHSKKSNAITIYNEVLKDGVLIDQGYVKDIAMAVEMLQALGIKPKDFKPNTIRLRKFYEGHKEKGISKYKYVLTLKDKKETKKREVEFKLSKEQFDKYWPETAGARVQKKRLRKKIKGFEFEIDAFTDRVLLIAECEVKDEKDLAKVPIFGMDITNLKDWSNKALSR